MLNDPRGTTITEGIVALAIVSIVVGVVYAIATTLQGKGNAVNSFFGGITVPSSP